MPVRNMTTRNAGIVAALAVLLATSVPALAQTGVPGGPDANAPRGQYGLPAGPPLRAPDGQLDTRLPGSGANPPVRGTDAQRPACPPQNPGCNPTLQR